MKTFDTVYTYRDIVRAIMVEAAHEFGRKESVLWRVLAALARHGYAVPPSDARDLMHDFYLEGWEGVNGRFNKSLGSFDGYLASAFYRFARRRILKFESLRQRTVEFESAVAELSHSREPPEILDSVEQQQAVKAAVDHLTPIEQQVLNEFLAGEESSERKLAAKYKLNRYALREVLTEAVGKVAVSLGQKIVPMNWDEQIAELLWKEGQAPRHVAHLLDVPVSQVHAARNRFVSVLLASMRESPPVALRRVVMSQQSPLELLRSALFAVGDKKALENVRAQASAIREAIEERDLVFEESQWSLAQKHPAWVAAIYDLLAGSEDENEPASELERVVDELRHNEQQEIGEAFGALLDGIPPQMHDWNKVFKPEQYVDEDYRHELLERSSVKAAGPSAVGLTHYGITPESFFSVTRGLELLFNRVERSTRNSSSLYDPSAPGIEEMLPRPLYLYFGPKRGSVRVAGELLLSEVASSLGLPKGPERTLTTWLFIALRFRPYLIQGYTAMADGKIMSMQWSGVRHRAESRPGLVARWSRPPQEVTEHSIHAVR